MRVLVTGGAGFIGSHVAEDFVKSGARVRVLDDFSTGRRENIEAFAGALELIEGSLADEDTVARAAEGVDVILHQGALPSVPRSHARPLESNDANVRGTLNVLLAARRTRAARVVIASSSSVYGDSETLPKTETMKPEPKSIYAATKLAGEHYAGVFHETFGVPTLCLRYFNVFGPRQDPASQYAAVIPRFITDVARGVKPTVFGDGTQSRDFTYVANVVHANRLAATIGDFPAGAVCNVACGARYDLLRLISLINAFLGAAVEPQFAPPRPGDVKHSLADVSLAKKLLGYEPVVSFEEGLRRTVEFFAGFNKKVDLK
ncbi:MAG: NAD-dependent epimerase/dehydratase family protein [bacterium]